MKEYEWKKVTEEVFYAKKRLVTVNRQNVDSLKKKAVDNKRKRSRLCAHNDTDDVTQEMIIVLGRNNYVHPHKHIGKSESFHIIEGSADLIFFDEKGQMTEVVQLGDYSSGKIFYYRIAAPFYHSVIVASDIFIFHETTKGPFVVGNRTDTIFATWAPKENDKEAAGIYMNNLIREREKIIAGEPKSF